MSGCNSKARPSVIDLSKRITDTKQISSITGVKSVEIDGINGTIHFETDGRVSQPWFQTLRVSVKHMQTGRETEGGMSAAEIVASTDSTLIVKVRPLFPNIGQISADHFRVEITTVSGLKKVLLCTPKRNAARPNDGERKAEGTRATAHVCTILPFRPALEREPAA